VQARLRLALVAVGSHLGHAGVVEGPGPPALLDPGAHSRDPGPGLAGVHRGAHAELAQVAATLAGHLQEMERVGRRAHQGGGPELVHPAQARRRVLAAARDGQGPDGAGTLETGPEADEETEGEGEEDAIGRAQAGPRQHEAPAPDPPVPRLLGVEPADRRAAGARGLMHAHVALQGIGEVGAERRIGGLVLRELALVREGQPPEVVPGGQIPGRADPHAGPLATHERIAVGGQQPGRPGLEPLPLERAQPVAGQRLERRIVHVSPGA
jgi:hypothetical protein